jgi:hypothetical protein
MLLFSVPEARMVQHSRQCAYGAPVGPLSLVVSKNLTVKNVLV